MSTKILPLIGLISLLFFGSCVDDSKGGVDRLKLANDCLEPIPFISLDTIKVENGRISYFINDQFEVADWFFYEEVIFYLWNNECFKEFSQNGTKADSVSFIISHNEQTVTSTDIPESFRSYSELRADADNYNEFFKREVYRPNFRKELVLLSHLYGKSIAPNPRNDVLYNENVLGFLLQVNTECDKSALTPENKALFDNLLFQLESHAQVDTIKGSLNIFNRCMDQ